MPVNIISQGDIRCSRLLSRNGTVMVYPGQTTDSSMVIAFRRIWTKHISYNLVHELNISPDDNIQDYLLIHEGDFVSINEIIASTKGKTPKSLTAKSSGRFLGISSGNLIFESMPEDTEKCIAGFPGTVTEIIPNRGAYLQTNGGYIEGIWGNGKTGQGILLSADMGKGGIFSQESISIDLAGAIVFANTCNDAETLQASAKMSPGGLIFGSLPANLLPVAERLPFPVIVTDVLGAGGKISDPVYMVLGENIIRFAYLYAVMSCGNERRRPEIIIPLEEFTEEKKEKTEVKIGSQVRVLDGFYGGEIGYVTAFLSENGSENESGITSSTADQVKVRIEQNLEVVLGINNVEVLNVINKK